MIPKEEIYMPPMNINVLDHRMFGRKPIVGVHVIKSLNKFRVNRDKKDFVIAKAERKFILFMVILNHLIIKLNYLALKKQNETIIIIPEKPKVYFNINLIN